MFKNTRRSIFTLLACAAFALLGTAVTPGEAKAAGWFNCQITAVFEHGPSYTTSPNQIQVECLNSISSGVNFIALRMDSGTFGVTNTEKQNRFASMAQAAILGTRRFRVYATDTACPGASNCRLVTAWSLYTP